MSRKIVLALTLMAAGRAMTLPFIGRAGDGGAGDPPEAWLMPLIGDAVIGLTALVVAGLIWKRPNPTTWLITVVWSAIAAFDAIAAFIVETSAPWPEFFMLEIFGRSMFFAATALHLVIIYLLTRPDARADFGLPQAHSPTSYQPA
ncbi:MAG: hypothetical protein ACR2QK_11825 [Acidimicrobiales bacterium]